MVPQGAAIPPCAQGYIKAGENRPLGWTARNLGGLSMAGLWPPGLLLIPGFYELPGFVTNSLCMAEALPGSLCCFQLQCKKRLQADGEMPGEPQEG